MLAREGRHFWLTVLFTHAKSTKNMVFFMGLTTSLLNYTSSK